MAEKRRDKKGRILRKGELQRNDGRYMYRYTNANGDRQVEYSWRLVDDKRMRKEIEKFDAKRDGKEKVS